MDDKLSELERRIERLEAEVRRLQAEKAGAPVGMPARTPAAAPPRPAVERPAPKPREPVDWEHTIGRVWLPRVFVFVLLFGVIWGFKAAVDFGIVTEPVRVGLGYLLAAGLLGFGHRQMKGNRALLGSVLLGGSVCALMLTTFAAHALYGYFGGYAAFALNALWVVLAIGLSHRYRSEGLAVLAAIGGLLVPLLVDIEGNTSMFYAAFEAMVYGAFLWYSLRMSFRVLYYAAAGLLHAALLALVATGGDAAVFAAVAVLQHLFLLGAYVLRSARIEEQAGTLLMSFALTFGWMWASYEEGTLHYALLSLAVLHSACAFALWRRSGKEAVPPSAAVATYALLTFLLSALDGEARPILATWEGIAALFVGQAAGSKFQRANGFLVYGIGVLLTAFALLDGMTAIVSIQSLLWLSLLGSLFAMKRIVPAIGKQTNVAVGVALLLLITDVTGCLTAALSDNAQRLSLSFAWALYAAAGVAYGAFRKSKQVRGIGLAMLFATLLKVIFFDLPNVPIAVRAILFIGIGLIGMLLSRLLYRKE
ncbi:DUF2339 domain-containing protein [Paenibacillus sp.]|uniref:DUF2339 domain-containing protein n=1 Tax=Paenibacillus sp. TaxID=58172 RepID=UPI002D4CEA22|nr:DUF2339 domain-containing protein [Paenibacillus sp.]HZG88105.1 DUF2339 domain-containing protein [Paenibacillus sp.]